MFNWINFQIELNASNEYYKLDVHIVYFKLDFHE